MSPIYDHLLTRYVDFTRTKVYLDHEQSCATFPTFNLNGQMTGYVRYNMFGEKKVHNDETKSKYYTYIGHSFGYQVWGLETCKSNYVYLTEGVFDAIRLHNLNLPALAILTNAPCHDLVQWLKVLNWHTIAILDNDPSGDKLKRAAQESYKVPNPYKDLGEMPEKELRTFMVDKLPM